jgi:hypothetical protein
MPGNSWVGNGDEIGLSPWGDPLGSILDRQLGFSSAPVQYDPLSQQLAALSYGNWQQAAQMQYPLEQQLISMAESPNYVAQARQQALAGANTSFAAQSGARQRLMQLLGVNPSAAQSAALGKQNALAQAIGAAGASNQAAALAAQTQQGMLQGFG